MNTMIVPTTRTETTHTRFEKKRVPPLDRLSVIETRSTAANTRSPGLMPILFRKIQDSLTEFYCKRIAEATAWNLFSWYNTFFSTTTTGPTENSSPG